jgi:hypothetical protein
MQQRRQVRSQVPAAAKIEGPRSAQLAATAALLNGKVAQRAALDEEILQGAGLDEKLLQGAGLDEELLQGAGIDEEELAQAAIQKNPVQRATNRTGLPENLKGGIEAMSGMSMDHVQVHYNSSQPAQLGAHAYAQGSDIHVAPGQTHHLPHEAWHVVQQAQGRVKPTTQLKQGVPVNDDAGLEREADVMGARAVAQGRSSGLKPARPDGEA